MEGVLGRLSLFEFVGVVIPGAVAVGGSYAVLAGRPGDIGAVEALGLVLVFYVVGHLLQALLRVPLIGALISPRREMRSTRLVDAGDKQFSDAFRALLASKVKARGWPELAAEPGRVFALARAELRATKRDDRAEMLLAMHFLGLGLSVASFVVAVSAVVALIDDFEWDRLLVGVAAAAACLLFHRRADDYDRYYADHVWADFAVLADTDATAPAAETGR